MNNDVVYIQLDRPRQLKFGHTAIKTVSALVGEDIEAIESKITPNNLEVFEKAFYAGLLFDARQNNEVLKLEDIPDLLDMAPSIAHTFEQFYKAWNIAWGYNEGNQPAPVEPGEQVQQENATGTKASE